MDHNIVKGVITKCTHEEKYDPNGILFKHYVLIVGDQQYTTQLKEKIYLREGMDVLLEIRPGSTNEVMAGYCVKEGYTWGQKPGHLKNKVSRSEKFEFLEGTVLEKRKSTTGFIYMNRSAISNRGSRISYTIVLENNDFHASRDEGEYLQVGMDIAVVLHKKWPVIILDKAAHKFIGLSKPYYIVFLLALIGFNAYMYYLYETNQTQIINYKPTLIVINIFLILASLLSIITFKITSAAKKFLLSEIKKETSN